MNGKSIIIISSLVVLSLIIRLSWPSAKSNEPAVIAPANAMEEEDKNSNKLYPHELYYLDRNYPDYNAPDGIYQDKLKQAIQYDQSAKRSNRGLDFPWTVQGPGNIGGRVNTIAVHPLNHNIFLLGYSQGGIYHTKNNGVDWRPVFDDQASLSISHIAYDPHSPNRIFATTGDVNISGYPFLGSGIYLSEDGGIHWTHSGLSNTGVLSKVVIDPFDGNIIYVGSMGYPSHKGIEKGLFRSSDAGQTWNKTLTVDDSTGIIDVVADPTEPGRVFASAWTRIRSSTVGTTVGPGTGLYRSDDYGETWIQLFDGLPGGFHSRTGLEITNDGTLFLSYIGLITEGECAGSEESLKAVYKSVDAGMTWDTINTSFADGVPCELVGGFGWYFEVLKVNPENSEDIFLLGVDIYRTLDGGVTWFEAAPAWWTYEVHADKHDLVFAGGELFLATDGGAYRQQEGAAAPWEDIENNPTTQFYRTAFNPHLPDEYFGGAQDNGTTGGNENFIADWPRIFGGDGFQPLFDPTEPSWMYALTQNGSIWFTQDDGLFWDQLNDGLYGSRYWDMPFVMSTHNPKILFSGSNILFRMNMADTVREWVPISPDLTKGDTILGNRYPAITSIAQSSLDELRLYAGTQDGNIWTTADGGINWTDITDGTPGHYVTSITPSTVDPQKVFATYSGYRDNDHTPYIYRSDNAGETWASLGVNLPMLGLNSFLILPGWHDDVMFAATDGGVYTTIDGGGLWERLGTNFPYMPVYDLEYNPVENTIVAATFSRGLMTFPVEELDLVSGVDPVKHHAGKISVYPTIVQNDLIVDLSLYEGPNEDLEVCFVDLEGRNVQQIKVVNSMQKKCSIKINTKIPPGVYFILVKDKLGSIMTSKIFKI